MSSAFRRMIFIINNDNNMVASVIRFINIGRHVKDKDLFNTMKHRLKIHSLDQNTYCLASDTICVFIFGKIFFNLRSSRRLGRNKKKHCLVLLANIVFLTGYSSVQCIRNTQEVRSFILSAFI